MDDQKNTTQQPVRRRAAAQKKAMEEYERELQLEAQALASQKDSAQYHDSVKSKPRDGERYRDDGGKDHSSNPKKKRQKKRKRGHNGCLLFLIFLLLAIAVVIVLGWIVFPEQKDELLAKIDAMNIPTKIEEAVSPLIDKIRKVTPEPTPAGTTPVLPSLEPVFTDEPFSFQSAIPGGTTTEPLNTVEAVNELPPSVTPTPDVWQGIEESQSSPEGTFIPTVEHTSEAPLSPEVVSTPTLVPEPTPTPYRASTARATESSDPSKWIQGTFAIQSGARASQANRAERVSFDDPQSYATRAGVFTYRGGPLRQNAAYGVAQINEQRLHVVNTLFTTPFDENHIGFGYSSQPVIINWYKNIREMMNLYEPLKEVIYPSDDGKIYFFNLDTQEATRDPINVGLPIDVAASVNPFGYPLLYVGQTASTAAGYDGIIGMRTYNLIDQSVVAFQSGIDEFATYPSGVISSSALVETHSDTLVYTAENGMLYTISMNTEFSPDGTLSLQPEVVAYGYQTNVRDGQKGIQASAAAYGDYVFFGDMSGIIQCVDLNTMKCIWAFDIGDSVCTNVSLECEEGGGVALYAGNVINISAQSGQVRLVKLNALTGELLWECTSDIYGKYDLALAEEGIYAGLMASPLVGEGDIDDLVIFNVNHVDEDGQDQEFYAIVFALDKQTGEEVWRQPLYVDSISSPVALYRQDGKSYLVMGDETGTLRLMDGYTGSTIDTVNLGSAIQSSPAAYENQIVVGTANGSVCFVDVQ